MQIHKVGKNKTICLDILNTLLVREQIADIEQLNNMQKDMIAFKDNYIVVSKRANQEINCCRRSSLGVKCLCRLNYYKIKPFALQFLKSISQFFELVAFAILPPF